MKKFSVPCNFGGQVAPFTIYIGSPKDGNHPLHFQSDWLSKERGGTIPPEVMDSIAKLKDLADKNNVSFEDLCVYALGAAQQEDENIIEDTGNTINPENLESDENAQDINDEEYVEDDSTYDEYDDNNEDSEDNNQTSDSDNNDGGIKIATAKIPADQAKQG
jgi:hypothetical protein